MVFGAIMMMVMMMIIIMMIMTVMMRVINCYGDEVEDEDN